MNKRTVLFNEHQKLGAKFTSFGGWEMPVQYTSIMEEHAAVRSHAGIFDTSHMGVVRIKGTQAAAFLKKITTADIDRMTAGQAKYSFLLNEKGGIVDDLIIYARSNDYLLVINAGNREKDVSWIMTHLINDVGVEDLSDQICLLALQGPAAQRLLQPLVYDNLSEIKYFHYLPIMFEPGQLAMAVARTGYTGEDGFELFVPVSHASTVWQSLITAGAKPCGLGCRDTLRLEACMPLHGHEISDDISPLEAKLERSICWNNDFMGKSALLNQKETGIHHFLTAFVLADGIARAGYAIHINGAPAGYVTSGTFSPTKKAAVALGYVDRPLNTNDTAQIVIHNVPRPATVVSMPFYKRVR
ncbi:MAG: glycine cleavage system aminomethyltransferase GcvT [Endomicrobiales bacterium]|jgi:aminomethyltransferase